MFKLPVSKNITKSRLLCLTYQKIFCICINMQRLNCSDSLNKTKLTNNKLQCNVVIEVIGKFRAILKTIVNRSEVIVCFRDVRMAINGF